MAITKTQVEEQLAEVYDPELNISIVDLGLVYNVEIKDDKVKIVMTLTTIGCPLFSQIEVEVKNKLQAFGIQPENVEIELTFDPPWSMEKISERAKAMLGI